MSKPDYITEAAHEIEATRPLWHRLFRIEDDEIDIDKLHKLEKNAASERLSGREFWQGVTKKLVDDGFLPSFSIIEAAHGGDALDGKFDLYLRDKQYESNLCWLRHLKKDSDTLSLHRAQIEFGVGSSTPHGDYRYVTNQEGVMIYKHGALIAEVSGGGEKMLKKTRKPDGTPLLIAKNGTITEGRTPREYITVKLTPLEPVVAQSTAHTSPVLSNPPPEIKSKPHAALPIAQGPKQAPEFAKTAAPSVGLTTKSPGDASAELKQKPGTDDSIRPISEAAPWEQKRGDAYHNTLVAIKTHRTTVKGGSGVILWDVAKADLKAKAAPGEKITQIQINQRMLQIAEINKWTDLDHLDLQNVDEIKLA